VALIRSVFEGGFNNRIVRLSLAAEELPNIARSGVRELWWTINHHAGIYNGEQPFRQQKPALHEEGAGAGLGS
jgi:hypothetical protein